MRVVKENLTLNHILQNIRLCRNSQFYLHNLYNVFVYVVC